MDGIVFSLYLCASVGVIAGAI